MVTGIDSAWPWSTLRKFDCCSGVWLGRVEMLVFVNSERHRFALAWLTCLSVAMGSSVAPTAGAQNPPTAHAAPDYVELKRRIVAEKDRLGSWFAAAQDTAIGTAISREATEYLRTCLADSILPAWLGTEWNYNGTTQTPGVGRIACGYFVTTCLRDAGFDLARVRLSQQPAELIINAFVPRPLKQRWSNAPIDRFVRDVQEMGHGIYLVGLDCHIGFLVVDSGGVVFWHASYLDPARVLRESALQSPILTASRYRVVGRVLPSEALVRAWLKGERIAG